LERQRYSYAVTPIDAHALREARFVPQARAA
jgi:hypothetical protein